MTTMMLPWGEECWSDCDQLDLLCRKVVDVTSDVKSFLFEVPQGRMFRFDPGQYVTIEVDIEGRRVSRCYTISSPPTRPYVIAITVKRVPGGIVSNWLHDNMSPGIPILVQAPLGSFTIADRPANKYLFLSAGSGITPLMSMTRTLYDLGSDADVLFIHSARTPADIIFRYELDAIAATAPNIRVLHLCESDHPADRWPGLRGRISAAALAALAPDLADRVTFTCGPAPYMASVRELLGQTGYDMHNYHQESFSFECEPADDQPAPHLVVVPNTEELAPPTRNDPEIATHRVEFTQTGQTVRCRSDETILAAAWAAGLAPASSCEQGMCGTCKSTVLSGSVDMHHNGGIRPREIAQGKILLCCSTPLDDLIIDA